MTNLSPDSEIISEGITFIFCFVKLSLIGRFWSILFFDQSDVIASFLRKDAHWHKFHIQIPLDVETINPLWANHTTITNPKYLTLTTHSS